MIIPRSSPIRRQRGALITELIVALAIVVIAVIPLAFSFNHEQRVLVAYYHQAAAMEIIDGELEILVAGEWRSFKPGAQPYAVKARAAKNLPKGQFTLTLEDRMVRLEWKPEKRGQGGRVVREVKLP